MGYGIMKYTPLSHGPSRTYPRGSQTAYVTPPALNHTPSSPPDSGAKCSLCLFGDMKETSPRKLDSIQFPAPLAPHSHVPAQDKIPLLGPPKNISGNESWNTIVCVPNISLRRNKREKICSGYFSLQMTEGEREWEGGGRGKEKDREGDGNRYQYFGHRTPMPQICVH